tara:strand:+ start:135 stop:635 length:501 start_codon:yes stop_codon:yes gene_type:complete
MSQLKEITDERWEAFVEKTKHFMEIGTDDSDMIIGIEYMINRGYKMPHVRDKLMGYIRTEVQNEYQVSYRGATYPVEVMNVIEIVIERYTAVLIEYFNGMRNFSLPMFRSRSHEMYWVDEHEFVDSKVKSLVNRLKKHYREEMWDGTIDGLHTIFSSTHIWQGDEA